MRAVKTEHYIVRLASVPYQNGRSLRAVADKTNSKIFQSERVSKLKIVFDDILLRKGRESIVSNIETQGMFATRTLFLLARKRSSNVAVVSLICDDELCWVSCQQQPCHGRNVQRLSD